MEAKFEPKMDPKSYQKSRVGNQEVKIEPNMAPIEPKGSPEGCRTIGPRASRLLFRCLGLPKVAKLLTILDLRKLTNKS